MEEARRAGYAVVGTATELQRAAGPKVLGLLNLGNMAFEIDRARTAEPSLAAMAAKTLEVLAKNRRGFFAMIQGGRIDLSAIQKAQTSFELIAEELGRDPTPERIRDPVKKHTAIEITEEEARRVANDTLHTLAFVLQSYLGVGWASQGHTASPLFAFGSGPGSEELVGFRHNTELFRIMKTALGAAPR